MWILRARFLRRVAGDGVQYVPRVLRQRAGSVVVMDAIIGSSTMEEGDEGKMTVERHWLIFR